jgi:DNA-binding GntR family transcriptional regulator
MVHTKRQTLSRENLSEQAYLAIRTQILHGKLALGSVLSRRKLATDLGMSMLPICTAIQRLEEEGLLESKCRVGTRVRIPTEQDIRGCNAIREALECQGARLVAERATLQQRHELLHMAEQLDALYRQTPAGHDPDFLFAIHGYHVQLHMKIAEFSGISALRELIEKNNVLVFNWLYDLVTPPPRGFHLDLVHAVTGGDMGVAGQAMRKHIRVREEDTIRAVGRANSNSLRYWNR